MTQIICSHQSTERKFCLLFVFYFVLPFAHHYVLLLALHCFFLFCTSLCFSITHLTRVNALYGGFTPNCQVPALKASTSPEKDVTIFAFLRLTIILLAKRDEGTCYRTKRHNKSRIILIQYHQTKPLQNPPLIGGW